MAVTLKDVAERAGVSRSAVSRTFTPGASVSDKTRKKVEKAARELGYRPSMIARSLATNRTELIGLIANNFQNPVFLTVFDLYTRALQERGLKPLLVNLTDTTDPDECLEMLRQYRVDGVIIATSTVPAAFATAFRNARMPVVHAFGRFSPNPAVHVVGIDNVFCGRLAADTLHRHGYTGAAFLGGPEQASSTQDRFRGFTDRAGELGLRLQRPHFARAYEYHAGHDAMTALLAGDRPEALFCGDDLICMGAMDAARRHGVSVPDELGFLGFNDMDMAGWRAYDLTTIRQPIQEIITTSVDQVISLVDEPDRTPETRLFPCSVVKRGTLRGGV